LYIYGLHVHISGLSLQAIQEIINTGTITWGEEVHPCTVWIGGDLPWLKRLLGISPCPQVASLYHEGVWDPVEKVYRGWEVRRTDASDKARREAYNEMGGSLANSGCINTPIVTHPERLNFVACVLHCSMALGRLLCALINRLADASVDKVALQRVLTETKTGFTVGSTSAPDGEDTHRLFGAWDLIAEVLGIDPRSDQHRAVVGIREMLKAMYVTKQEHPLATDYCAKRVRAFEKHCMEPGKGGHYISLLKCDFDLLMRHIYPFGLALFCNDVIESLNRFLKLAYTEHSSRGGGVLEDDGVDAPTGLPNKHFHAQSANLVQCFEWVFLYFDIFLVVHGHPRPRASQATAAFEPSVARPSTVRPPPQLSSSLNNSSKHHACPEHPRHSRHRGQVSPLPELFVLVPRSCTVPRIPHSPPQPPPPVSCFSLALACCKKRCNTNPNHSLPFPYPFAPLRSSSSPAGQNVLPPSAGGAPAPAPPPSAPEEIDLHAVLAQISALGATVQMALV
jgi:hypothetical protein